jgi:glycosyltransferase involved in cell wall biosynthesis
MKILFVAPIPPPVNGQSLASKIFLDFLKINHEVVLININKNRPKSFFNHIGRFLNIISLSIKVLKYGGKNDRIYFSISESFLGNIKDIFFYILCFRNLNNMIIHLHGGAGMINIMSGKFFGLDKINLFFLNRIGKIIILGESHKVIYKNVMLKDKISVVPNFSEDYLFYDAQKIKVKFDAPEKLEFLFLSNMIFGKGHIELLEAFLSLPKEVQSRIKLNFAGEIRSKDHRREFEIVINNHSNIAYHGIVHGEEKKLLFNNAHVFCLPTYYPYEGQPISILEAYASGCIVMTTDHSGIRDVFEDKVNGYLVEKKSVSSIVNAIINILNARNIDLLYKIGLNNWKTAESKYRVSEHCKKLERVLQAR